MAKQNQLSLLSRSKDTEVYLRYNHAPSQAHDTIVRV